MREEIFIKDFSYDAQLIETLDLLLVIKSFDVQAIRKRYLAARENKSGKTGSVERREPGLGGLVEIKIESDRITASNIISRLKEPRAMDMKDAQFSIAPEDQILLIHRAHSERSSILNDWFSYIHKLKYHPTEDKLLVCSSGFDCFFEYDLSSGHISYEWFSWDHGLNMGKDADGHTQYLVRKKEDYKNYIAEGHKALLISDPKTQSLPTAQRAAFINAADYDLKAESYLLTLFHEGKVISVNPESGEWQVLIEDLKNPHGGMEIEEGIFLVTNTADGSIVIRRDLNGAPRETAYSFKGIEGKVEEMAGKSWIQNSIYHDGKIISIDSNRNSLFIIDINSESYSRIPFDPDWAVQDILVGHLDAHQKGLLA